MLSKRLTLHSCVLTLLAAALCSQLRAAELGEVKVNSHIGQQLSADIELVDLTPADLADIQARLANPDVFKGASLEVPSELAGLHIAVASRDNKRFLHLTTLQPVNASALHLFLELSSSGRQIIRAASLWLTPEAPGQRVAPPPPAAAPVSIPPQPVVAPVAVAAAPKVEAAPQPVIQAPPRKTPAKPAGMLAVPVAPAQSCASAKQVETQLQQCQAMTSKLADVESKVQRLQKAIVAVPVPAPVGAKPDAALPKQQAAPPKPDATAIKPGVAADLAGNPRKRMAMIGGGALLGLAALAGLIFFLRKRQARGPLRIWQSFRRKGHPDDDVPTLEDAVEVVAQ